MIRSTVGYWHETIDPAIDPPLRGAAHVDVAIVGGGFTGLATAYELKRAAPQLRVAVLEAETIGYGASGRNGGFAMTLFGLQMSITAARFGKQHAREAHRCHHVRGRLHVHHDHGEAPGEPQLPEARRRQLRPARQR